MKKMTILDLNTLNLRTALVDETIFILKERRQQKAYHDDETELRCSCMPLCTMNTKMLRDMMEHMDQYQAIKIEPD